MYYLVVGEANVSKLLLKGFTLVDKPPYKIENPDAYVVCPPKNFNFSQVDVPMMKLNMTF